MRGVRYEGCDPGADVVFYTISDGGHTWPGGKPLPKSITGKTTQEIDATRLMRRTVGNHIPGVVVESQPFMADLPQDVDAVLRRIDQVVAAVARIFQADGHVELFGMAQ